MWRKSARAFGVAMYMGLAAAAQAAAVDAPVLTKAEFHAVAVEGLTNANGISRERAAARLSEILEAARTYPGSSSLARKVRTGYGHYEKSRNIRKKHVARILRLFATAEVAELSEKEAAAVLSAWPNG